jgi:hypothetical protein
MMEESVQQVTPHLGIKIDMAVGINKSTPGISTLDDRSKIDNRLNSGRNKLEFFSMQAISRRMSER